MTKKLDVQFSLDFNTELGYLSKHQCIMASKKFS